MHLMYCIYYNYCSYYNLYNYCNYYNHYNHLFAHNVLYTGQTGVETFGSSLIILLKNDGREKRKMYRLYLL